MKKGRVLFVFSLFLISLLLISVVNADIYVGSGGQCSGSFYNPPGPNNHLCSQNGYDTHNCLCLGATNGKCTACDDTSMATGLVY